MPGIGHRGAGSEEPITDPEDVKQDNLPIPQDELEVSSRPAQSRSSGSELPAAGLSGQAGSAGRTSHRRCPEPGHRGAQFLHLPGEFRHAAPSGVLARLGDLADATDLTVERVEATATLASAIAGFTSHDGGPDGQPAMRAAQRVAHSSAPVEAVSGCGPCAAPRRQAGARSSACCARYASHRAVYYWWHPKIRAAVSGADHKTVTCAVPGRPVCAREAACPGRFTARYLWPTTEP